MRHLFTISLVFFSLSHLAKVDRVEAMRHMADRYCAKQQVSAEQSSIRSVQDLQDLPHLFLSNNQLSAIGILSSENGIKFRLVNQSWLYATTLAQPRNNSP